MLIHNEAAAAGTAHGLSDGSTAGSADDTAALIARLIDRGQTKSQVARGIGVNPSQITRILSGKQRARKQTHQALERLLAESGADSAKNAEIESATATPATTATVARVVARTVAPDDRAHRLAEARRFLSALDDEAECWSFQVFDDSGQKRGGLTRVLHGDIEELFSRLDTLNANGAGVYVTVNETDGKGRKEENIVRVRAGFADFDPPKTAAAPASYPLEPVIVVESSPGKHHVYWTVDDLALDDFENQQRGIIAALGSDTQPHDLPRVMRVPGFRHMKDPSKPHPVRIVSTEPRLPYSAAELARAFPPVAKVNVSGKASGERPDTNQDPVVQALSERGLVIGKRQDAAFNIRCPWEEEHTTPSTATSTVYFPPHTGGYEGAAFKCQHEHCRDRTAAELRRVLGLADGPSAEHGAQVAAAMDFGRDTDTDDHLGLHDVERLLAWSWRIGTRLPSARSTGIFEATPAKAGERPLERLRSPIAAHPTHSAPWPKLAWENGTDGFLQAAEPYSARRYEKVCREAERTKKPPMDIPADELMLDAEGWLARVRSLDVGDDEGLALLEQVQPEWPELHPLVNVTEPQPYPIDALPQTIQAAVREVQGFVQAPLPMVAASSLSALSLGIQGHVDVARASRLQGPVSLYQLVIADSGERKTTVDGFFTGAVREYERQQAEAMRPELERFEADAAAWQAEKDGVLQAIKQAAKSGKSTRDLKLSLEAIEHAKPTAPRVPKLLRGDDTPETLAYQLARGWPSSGVLSSEAAVIFGSHGMSDKSVTRNLGLLNVLWEGGTLDVGRRTSESFTVRGARFTSGLMVQQAVLRDFNAKAGAVARGSGYWARFLVCWPASTQGTRLFREPPEQWPALAAFNHRLSALLEHPVTFSDDGGLEPHLLQLTPEAKSLWVQFHDAIEGQLAPEGELFDVRDVASKVADNAVRLAALLQVFVHGVSDVDADMMASGCRLAAWHLSEAQRFFGELAIPPDTLAAIQLERWIVAYCQRHQTTEVPRREVQRLITPSSLREGGRLDIAIGVLTDHGRVREVVDGKRKVIEVRQEALS